MKEIIGIRNLNVEFGTKKVLSDINLDFETGKITVIVGRNGSGKSVLLQTILNLIKYTGDIWIEYKTHHDVRVFEIIGFVPSESYVMHDTINEFLNYVGKLNNLTNKQISERTQLFAKLFNLTNKLDYKFNTLSLGEQKKVMIIQSVLHDPEIIIMDEPTNALDNESLREFTSFIKYLKELNKTVIFSSHDINSINNFGVDKIIYISNGKIIKNDILDEDVGARLNKYSKDNNDTPYVPTDIKTKSIYNKK